MAFARWRPLQRCGGGFFDRAHREGNGFESIGADRHSVNCRFFHAWISYNDHGFMNLFMLRHASAGTGTTDPEVDRKRPLDKEGVRHCLQLAQVLNSMKIGFDLIVSSPLKRSLQTATLVATETGYKSRVLQSDSLAPEATLKDFRKLLDQYRDRDSLLVVGHNPSLTVFVGALIALAPASSDPAP
jgi:phosphohistidine phosphatase